MLKTLTLLCGLVLTLGLLACGGSGGPVSDEAAEGTANPEARLREMSDFLSAAPSIRLNTREAFQWLNPEGERQEVQAVWEVNIWRPDAMRITMTGEGSQEFDVDIYYDGWKLTFVNHKQKVWAWASVANSLDELLDEIYWRFNLPIPMKDMLYSSPYDQLMTEDTESRYVGREEIEGRPCDRFSFSHEAVDWEIWIEAGEQPLPRRLDIIHKNLEQHPESEIIFTEVDLSPAVDETLFTFDPPDGYIEIPAVENPPPDESGEEPVQAPDVPAEGSAS